MRGLFAISSIKGNLRTSVKRSGISAPRFFMRRIYLFGTGGWRKYKYGFFSTRSNIKYDKKESTNFGEIDMSVSKIIRRIE